jgi:hypothetical protein
MKKIAFLFLFIDNPNFPDIWDHYLKNNENKYTIYIHPKYPKKHTWRPKNIIPELKETEWGHIVEAEVSLFKEAYKNKKNYKFITISESCVPIKTFNEFYKDVIGDPQSWIKMMKISNYDKNERIINFIKSIKNEDIIVPPLKSFIKHYARFCLNREHIEKIINASLNNKIEFFYKMPIGDEFCLTILNLKDNEYKNFATTYDDWDYVKKEIEKLNKLIKECYDLQEKTKKNMNKDIEDLKKIKNNIAKNPKMITIISNNDLKNIKVTKSYFYRKFSKKSDISNYWQKIITGTLNL